MCHSWMGLCSEHDNYVVIRELSLYPQSLIAKLTVHVFQIHIHVHVRVFQIHIHIHMYMYMYMYMYILYFRYT